MPDDIENLVRRLIGGDDQARREILNRARTEDSPVLLVAAALVADDPADLLTRAARSALTTRDRQLVAIAEAYFDDDEDRLNAFVRDHLSDHPDNVLAAWIAARPPTPTPPGATMPDLVTTPSPRTTKTAVLRGARWMVTFVGYPLGGLAAELLVGPVDGPGAALVGGLITGTILGTVQVWGLGRHRPPAAAWIAATALGLMVGLGAGAGAVGYATSLGALAVQGAICGAAVGVAQAMVLRGRLRHLALAWPPALAAIWAAGWAVTTSIGVQVDRHFTVFGSSGALVVTALTAVLPFALNKTATVHIGTERSAS